MSDSSKPDIVFQQSVFRRELLLNQWPHLKSVIGSADEVAAAFEAMERDPMWREDPLLVQISKPIAKEILNLYNAVVADGQHIALFERNPAAAAKKLRHRVSKKALTVLTRVQKKKKPQGIAVAGAAVVISVSVAAIAVTTAIVSSHSDKRDRILVDDSGKIKIGTEKSKPGNAKKKKKKAKKAKKAKKRG